MNSVLIIKNYLRRCLKTHPVVFQKVYFLYAILRNPNGRMHKISYGTDNPDKTYFIIRPRINCIEGLMALLIYVLQKTKYAKNNDMLFVVDMKNYKTQYSSNNENVWDWFFLTKNNISLETVYRSKNVVLSGYTLKKIDDEKIVSKDIFFNKNIKKTCRDLFNNNFIFSNDVMISLAEERKKIRIDLSESIGVFIRGTDYVKLKPFGEPIQPKPEEVILKIIEFRKLYGELPIFLVTEDSEIYEKICSTLSDVHTITSDILVKGYRGKDFLSQEDVLEKNKKLLGIRYLIKILLLSECGYFIGSIAGGSKAAYIFKKGEYKAEYIFDKGEYM